MSKNLVKSYYDRVAATYDRQKARNAYYHRSLVRLYRHVISEDSLVMEVGCATGDLLNAVRPSVGVGIDFSEEMIAIAKTKYPELTFEVGEAGGFDIDFKPDYIILSDVVSILDDIQKVLHNVRKYCAPHTKIIINAHSYGWEPLLSVAQWLRLKPKRPKTSWLTTFDLDNLLRLEGFEVIKSEKKMLIPINIPILSYLINYYIANLPLINRMGLINMISARPLPTKKEDKKVSIVVPARNERGNIEAAITRTPKFGSAQEFIFIEGHSADGTYEEMLRVKEKYADVEIVTLRQSGKGKGNAVREAFAQATGEVLMILDADLTTPPESMPKFYRALIEGKGDFINGCRLVYPMEKQAMRHLNFIANKFFGVLFSYLLGQRLKDTLCGTKVLFKKDYDKIIENRSYFGDFDPFGDFDLLFGAAKLNLKICEVIVRYKDRQYGSTQISRFRHGLLLIRMSVFAARKIKFIS